MKHLGLKLAALLSFCGGPLFLCDELKRSWGTTPAFLLAFAPVALLAFGTLSLTEDAPEPFPRRVVQLGMAGALVLLGLNLWTAVCLDRLPPKPAHRMIEVGLVVGTVAAIAYLRAALRFLGPPPRPRVR